jgi:hypothetical protein
MRADFVWIREMFGGAARELRDVPPDILPYAKDSKAWCLV